MYPRSFLCEEAKIKQRAPLKKELCEIGEKAIWDSHPFYSFIQLFPMKETCRITWIEIYLKINFIINYYKNANKWKQNQKKHINWDPDIASSLISQSSFFEEVCCLILASSQRKLRGYIEFLKFMS